MTIKMYEDEYYGVAKLPKEIFDKLDSSFFISRSTDTVKYMCANNEEFEHMKSLGIDTEALFCDWYRLELLK